MRANQRFRFGRNVGILAAGEVLSRGLNFLAFSLLARLLSLSGYGLLELAQAFMVLLTLVADLGTGKTGTREIAANGGSPPHALVETIVWVQALLSIVIVLLVVVGTYGRAEPGFKRLFFGFALSLLGFPFLLGWFFLGQSQMMPVAVLQVVGRGVFLGVTLLIVRSPSDLFRVPWAEVAAVATAATSYVALMRATGRSMTGTFHVHRSLLLLRQSLPIGGSQLVWACQLYLPMLILALYCDSTSVAFFGAALRIVVVAQALLATYFTTLFPALSEVSSAPRGVLGTYLDRSLRSVLWPLVVIAIATTVCSPIMIRLVFGFKFVKPEATTTLAVLIWVLPILAWRRHYAEALIALRRAGDELVCSLVGLVLLVPLTVSFARIGVLAGAWAMLISEVVVSALTAWRLRHYLREGRTFG
jgi:O-antigen/teichoic acid export membrane protein